MNREQIDKTIEKLKMIIASYLMSGEADNDICGEWREVLETSIKALEAQIQEEPAKFDGNIFDEYEEVFRDATKEEQESVNNYVKSISRSTGLEFDEEVEELDFIEPHKSIPCKIKVQEENPCFHCYTGAIGECAMANCKYRHESWSKNLE